MYKVVNPGKVRIGQLNRPVFLRIEFTDDRLSISGVEGPLPSGNCYGSCGQITDTLKSLSVLSAGWTPAMVGQLHAVWNRWHLNDMRAGTPAQMSELEKHTFPGYPMSHYEWATDLLRNAGLNPDNGYKYGSAWLREDVPAEVVDFLESLPESAVKPAWV